MQPSKESCWKLIITITQEVPIEVYAETQKEAEQKALMELGLIGDVLDREVRVLDVN